MPTLLRNWTSSQNNSCADQTTVSAQTKEILLDIKTKMVAAGWTVTQSSDSVTADATDRWNTVADIVNAAGAHSWIVLKSPAGYCGGGEFIYFGIDYNTATDNYANWGSRGDADWTGLSTTTGPAASATNINPFTYIYNQGVVTTGLQDTKFHSHYSDEGDIIYYTTNSNNQFPSFLLMINKCSDTEATDLYPIVTYIWGFPSANTTLNYCGAYSANLQNVYMSKGFHPTTGVGSGQSRSTGAVWRHLILPTSG